MRSSSAERRHRKAKAERNSPGSPSAGDCEHATDNADVNASRSQASQSQPPTPFNFDRTSPPHVLDEDDLRCPSFVPQIEHVDLIHYDSSFPSAALATLSSDPKPPAALGQALSLPPRSLREYLDGRRSSRESPMSMIANASDATQSDDGSHSVSELATSQASDDHTPWVRSSGLDEAPASPAALDPASIPLPASPPGMMEIQSPYPIALQEEDLYEPGPPEDVYTGPGKRSACTGVPLDRSVSHQPEKRRHAM